MYAIFSFEDLFYIAAVREAIISNMNLLSVKAIFVSYSARVLVTNPVLIVDLDIS